jgi:hypothetical protein
MFKFLAICAFALFLNHFKFTTAIPEYTAKEKAALVKFRELVKDVTYADYMKSDPYLIRWIRTKDFDLNEASKMLRTAIKWRKANKIDGILNETFIEFHSPPYYLDGIDYEGSQVLVLLPARVDMRRIVVSAKRPEAVRFFDQLMEKGEQTSLKLLGVIGNNSVPADQRPDLLTVVMDMQGYSLRQHACLQCLTTYVEWMTHMETYYPGYTKHFIIINAPRIAVPVVELLKPVMSRQTRNAFQVFTANKKEWGPVLKKIIPPDQVRANLGGTRPE